MNVILEPFKALWRRKLWPVAVALVAALVAVPMVLAKNPEPTVAPANAGAATAEGMPATFVSAAETPEAGARRRVLGAAKDPFAPAGLSKKAKAARRKAAHDAKKAAAEAKAATKASAKASASDSGSTAGSGSDAGPSTTTGPPASAPPAPAPTVPKYSIKVNFGKVDEELSTSTVERLKVLPTEDAPLLIYRGVEDGGKVAVFELTGNVVAMGDGKCEPNPEDCQILKLKAGETEFLTISDTGTEADAQYQLDLVKINKKQTTEKSELAKAGSTGMSLLKHLAGKRTPRYAFDSTTGTLHKLSKKKASKLTKSAQRASL